MFDDSTVKSACCFFGGGVCPKGSLFAAKSDPCLEPRLLLGHSHISSGICWMWMYRDTAVAAATAATAATAIVLCIVWKI